MRRWDGESGESVGEPLRGHELEVTSVALSGDGRLIVSGSGKLMGARMVFLQVSSLVACVMKERGVCERGPTGSVCEM